MRELRLYRVAAITLRHHNFAETDRLVTLFSRERGKVRGIAKGVRRPKSRLAAGLQPFTYARLQLAVGSNLDVITQCEVVEPFAALREDLARMAWGSYLMELLDSAVPEHEASPRIFNLTLHTLRALRESPPLTVVNAFQVRLSHLLGYGPLWEACANCGGALAADGHSFSASSGGMLCRRCRGVDDAMRLTGAAITASRALLSDPQQMALNGLSTAAATQLFEALRAHLEARLDRRFRSPRIARLLAAVAA